MLKQRDRDSEMRLRTFRPKKVQSIEWVAENYNSTMKYDARAKDCVQAMDNLTQVHKDGKVWADLTTTYGSLPNYYGPKNELLMYDPSWQKIQDFKAYLKRSFLEDPEVPILNLYLVASHGIVESG